jgi:hypothetical protein
VSHLRFHPDQRAAARRTVVTTTVRDGSPARTHPTVTPTLT